MAAQPTIEQLDEFFSDYLSSTELRASTESSKNILLTNWVRGFNPILGSAKLFGLTEDATIIESPVFQAFQAFLTRHDIEFTCSISRQGIHYIYLDLADLYRFALDKSLTLKLVGRANDNLTAILHINQTNGVPPNGWVAYYENPAHPELGVYAQRVFYEGGIGDPIKCVEAINAKQEGLANNSKNSRDMDIIKVSDAYRFLKLFPGVIIDGINNPKTPSLKNRVFDEALAEAVRANFADSSKAYGAITTDNASNMIMKLMGELIARDEQVIWSQSGEVLTLTFPDVLERAVHPYGGISIAISGSSSSEYSISDQHRRVRTLKTTDLQLEEHRATISDKEDMIDKIANRDNWMLREDGSYIFTAGGEYGYDFGTPLDLALYDLSSSFELLHDISGDRTLYNRDDQGNLTVANEADLIALTETAVQDYRDLKTRAQEVLGIFMENGVFRAAEPDEVRRPTSPGRSGADGVVL
jgi:hypothetical protein